MVFPPGLLVIVHEPAGKPLSTTLPVDTEHVGWVMVLTTGAVGIVFTVSVYVAVAGEQGEPSGLSVVIVIVTVLPASAVAGV